MERTYMTIDGHQQLVEGTTEQVTARWEAAMRDQTMLRLRLPDNGQLRCVNPMLVVAIGPLPGGGGTLAWDD